MKPVDHSGNPIKFAVSASGEFSVIFSESEALITQLEIHELREMAFALLGAAVSLEDSAAVAMQQFDNIVASQSTAAQKGNA